MRLIANLFLTSLTLITLSAHDIITTNLTFTRDISRIFAQRCLGCHSPTDSIPLTTYEQARPWAVAIKQQVLSRKMPPWGAVKGFGHLSPDNSLTQEEIMVIAAWVVGGSPQGDPAFLPKLTVINKPAPLAPMRDALIVTTETTLQKPLTITGIRPLTTSPIDSARIIASYPDGHIDPLLWLFQYDPASNKLFRFREPLSLPRGTVIASAAPLQFALETNFKDH
jgi:hypothetical protein